MASATIEMQTPIIQQMARPITGAMPDYDPVLDLIGEARFVLMGEASHGTLSKIVVWEYNSHLGDARATELGEGGELNVGQLVRQRYGEESRSLGFTTYGGTVTAADDWDEPGKRKRVRKALPESYEGLFHDLNINNFFVNLRDGSLTDHELERLRLERAIGVIYRPETERLSHYFFARLSSQFDGIIHLDQTRALEPLERTAQWEMGEPPETYPSGI